VHDPQHTPATVVAVVDAEDGTEIAVGRLDARKPDLAMVDELIRLQLLAGRCGSTVLLWGASEELRALLELVGLAEVLTLEARREPELCEELRVEEVMQPADPPA
jgi:hypothetical protein